MAHEIFVAGEPTESETTEECTERITQLGDELFAQGCEPEEVHFSQLSINYMRDLKEAHREANRTNPVAMDLWALKLLAASSFEDVEDLQDLEARVRALGMIAGLSYDQIANYVTRIWYTTPTGSAARAASSSVCVKSSDFSTPMRSEARSGKSQPDSGLRQRPLEQPR